MYTQVRCQPVSLSIPVWPASQMLLHHPQRQKGASGMVVALCGPWKSHQAALRPVPSMSLQDCQAICILFRMSWYELAKGSTKKAGKTQAPSSSQSCSWPAFSPFSLDSHSSSLGLPVILCWIARQGSSSTGAPGTIRSGLDGSLAVIQSSPGMAQPMMPWKLWLILGRCTYRHGPAWRAKQTCPRHRKGLPPPAQLSQELTCIPYTQISIDRKTFVWSRKGPILSETHIAKEKVFGCEIPVLAKFQRFIH